MKYYVYILHSKSLNRYYIGQTSISPMLRLAEHNTLRNVGTYTNKGIPWTIYLSIECSSREVVRDIERHVKKAKIEKIHRKFSKVSQNDGEAMI